MEGDEQDRLGVKLRDLLIETREGKGLSQTQLSRTLGLHQVIISNYERGERRVDVVEFIQIARALGEDPMDLFRRLVE